MSATHAERYRRRSKTPSDLIGCNLHLGTSLVDVALFTSIATEELELAAAFDEGLKVRNPNPHQPHALASLERVKERLCHAKSCRRGEKGVSAWPMSFTSQALTWSN